MLSLDEHVRDFRPPREFPSRVTCGFLSPHVGTNATGKGAELCRE